MKNNCPIFIGVVSARFSGGACSACFNMTGRVEL